MQFTQPYLNIKDAFVTHSVSREGPLNCEPDWVYRFCLFLTYTNIIAHRSCSTAATARAGQFRMDVLPARALESGGAARNGRSPVPQVEELLDQDGRHATRHSAGGKHAGAGPAVQVLRRGPGACPLAPNPSGCRNDILSACRKN